MSLEALSRMPEREFRSWQRYAAQKPLPTRRIEYAIAMLASVVARVAGNGEATLADFVLDYSERPKKRKANAEGAAMAIGSMAGVGVRKLGRKRRAA